MNYYYLKLFLYITILYVFKLNISFRSPWENLCLIIFIAGALYAVMTVRDRALYISNIYNREEFRQKSLISDIVTGGIFGLGIDGYILAIISMQKLLKNEN